MLLSSLGAGMGQELPRGGRLRLWLQQQEGGSLFPPVPVWVPKNKQHRNKFYQVWHMDHKAKATKREQQETVTAGSHEASAQQLDWLSQNSALASGSKSECYRETHGLSGCWKYHLLPIYLATTTLPEVIFSRPDLTTGAQGQCWTTPGANGINNRAQVLIQGEGFHRANKHPVGSTGVHMAAGRTSALRTSGSFKKQSAGERHDLFDNANQHCQQALP